MIGVKWKFGNQVIDEPTKQVDYDGPKSTEFHLQNSGGFPPGDYSVDVFIDGVQVGTRAFKVGDVPGTLDLAGPDSITRISAPGSDRSGSPASRE